MKHKRNIILLLILTACMVIFCSFPVFAAELTEAEVEQAVQTRERKPLPVIYSSGFSAPSHF